MATAERGRGLRGEGCKGYGPPGVAEHMYWQEGIVEEEEDRGGVDCYQCVINKTMRISTRNGDFFPEDDNYLTRRK